MALFLEAMSGVTPFNHGHKKTAPHKAATLKPAHPPPDEESVVIKHLKDLIAGDIEMDITFSDEYIEGAVDGVSQKMIRRLKRGRIPVQDYIDLHGLTRETAQDAVQAFLVASRKRGYRCVLIVHGRGLNSPEQLPVLKEMLPKWLNQGPARKIVLAFATSRPYDGGTGATYVLLRRR
ncbi:MAG: Smr/MutS family protein [Deltaproteobacteria bacterium]|nr:Smr/MutS family protein [Deltaproteobacteria bacterium]